MVCEVCFERECFYQVDLAFMEYRPQSTIGTDCNRTKMIGYSKIILHNEAGGCGCRFLIILLCSQHNPLIVCVRHVAFLQQYIYVL